MGASGREEAGSKGTLAGRLDIAAIEAFVIWTSGGFIPQARHGGSGVFALAVAGSKLTGTGLEKEQMGHIHVALVSRG